VPLLSFVVGSRSAAVALEKTLRAEGDELLEGPQGPSLAFPACCYDDGAVPPRPWGVSWGNERPEVVAFVAHTRMIFNICARMLIAIDDDAFSLNRIMAEAEGVDEEVIGDEGRADEEQVDEAALGAEANVEGDDPELEAAAIKIQQAARARQARKSQAEENPPEDAED